MGTKKTPVRSHGRKPAKIYKNEPDRQEPRIGTFYHDPTRDITMQTWTIPHNMIDRRQDSTAYPAWPFEQHMWPGSTPEVGHIVAQPLYHHYPVDQHPLLPPGPSHPTMALPGHSPLPPPFARPGSPSRSLNGYHDAHMQYPVYGPPARPMPPPSPHNFLPPRYSHSAAPPPPASSALNYSNDTRPPPPPHKRPGSSMSISSMLGSEPEKPQLAQQDSFYPRQPQRPDPSNGLPMSLGAVMSPPQYPPRPVVPDYTYKPRSRTPDRLGDHLGTRPHRSSSGSLMQRPGPFLDHTKAVESQPQLQSQFDGSRATVTPPAFNSRKDEAAERARRTSISGILQRPESEPVRPPSSSQFPSKPPSTLRPEFTVPTSFSSATFGSAKPALPNERLTGSYDTRPPTLPNSTRPSTPPSTQDPRETMSRSPEVRRSHLNGGEPRSLAGLLNNGAEHMQRQESVQSQISTFGDRHRSRAFSPFTGSVVSQTMSTTSVPIEDQVRKGSDELSQHRAVLAIAADAKRGRYSPVPQAVQGAQAQTPVPDAGIKSEHGRVFAGLGGGLGSSTGHTSTPVGLVASPFKQNDATRLSEENLMKVSRSTSGINKRARKYDEDLRAESDVGDVKKSGSRKKSKYAHAYKVDLENDVNRRSTPLSALNGIRRTGTPTNGASQQLHHHHQPQRQPAADAVPLFKPKKTIRISSVISAANRYPRRHLGSFTYDPEIANAEVPRLGFEKFDISIKPNLLPAFTQADQINCTYNVRIPKVWLQERERGLICKEAHVWGSGVYTDDSDVVAAAMHAGYIQAQAPGNVDKILLSRVEKEQNAKLEGLADLPEQPVEPEFGRDAIITCVVLPVLGQYVSSSRFGVTSRSWPERGSYTPHDGVGFAILKVDFVAGGIEGRRMGRTGKEKRKRMQKEQNERLASELLLRRMLEQARMKLKEQGKPISRKAHPLSVAQNASDLIEKEMVMKAVPALDVGHAPGEWLKKVEVEAS